MENKKDFWSCVLCGINSIKDPNRSIPCPRFGCEAKHTGFTFTKTVMFTEGEIAKKNIPAPINGEVRNGLLYTIENFSHCKATHFESVDIKEREKHFEEKGLECTCLPGYVVCQNCLDYYKKE
jgi:hypothetical protein